MPVQMVGLWAHPPLAKIPIARAVVRHSYAQQGGVRRQAHANVRAGSDLDFQTLCDLCVRQFGRYPQIQDWRRTERRHPARK